VVGVEQNLSKPLCGWEKQARQMVFCSIVRLHRNFDVAINDQKKTPKTLINKGVESV
jgi:hypothetical protein